MIEHEFILVEKIPDIILISDFSRRDMTAISDDFVLEHCNEIKKIKMYWGAFGNTQDGLNYHGITIITSSMASELLNTLQYCKGNAEAKELKHLLTKSIANKQSIIHFGI